MKNLLQRGTIGFLAISLLLTGCAPSGSRALLKGKKLMERGNYAAAVEQLKIATTLLSTNAQAWNYLGVAFQYAGQTTNATAAYQRALALDRDLMEVHYNLGCLWLDQGRPDAAASEFTAYTLRRSKAPEGWIKLGFAQLQSQDALAAEKSFSTAYYLCPSNTEALNGLGLARMQRDRPHEAAQFFTAAIKENPDFGPALLNLAAVAQEHLHDNALALQNYRAYLALKPRPNNWDEVNNLVNSLEPPVQTAESQTAEPEAETARAATPQRTQADARNPLPQQHTPANASPTAKSQATFQTATVTQPASTPSTEKTGIMERLNPLNWFHSQPASKSAPVPAASTAPAAPAHAATTPQPRANTTQVTHTASTPAHAAAHPSAPAAAPKPAKAVAPAASTFSRYNYLSPRKPAPGDRKAASVSFARARTAEQDSQWSEALQSYRQATQQDPAWFEAQYNFGVIAYRMRDYNTSLAAYETALALQPDSMDARFNFALALKAAGFVNDAVNELDKILAAKPNDVRTHLALGIIYAQQLHDNGQARQHYQKVLQLDPSNPKAADIQFWLNSNPG